MIILFKKGLNNLKRIKINIYRYAKSKAQTQSAKKCKEKNPL